MALRRSLFRLIALDGNPHPVLDAPYESMEAALAAAQDWCSGQGMHSGLRQRGIGIEQMTQNGSWRTVHYPLSCLSPVASQAFPHPG